MRASVPVGAAVDLSGTPNAAQPAFLRAYVPSQIPSVVSISFASANPTNSFVVKYTVVFDSQVSGVDTADFTVLTTGNISGASLALVSGSGASRTVFVKTGTGNGTVQLILNDNDTIVNGLGKPLGGVGGVSGASGPAYSIQGR